MGVNKLHSLGREQDVRALFEDSFGTFRRPTTSSTLGGNTGIQVNSCNLQKEKQAITRKFTNPLSRDHSSRIKHKTKCEGNIELDIVPSGTVGTRPDVYPLLFMGVGGMRFTATLEITAYASMSGDAFTLTMEDNENNSITETFTEGSDFTAATSNTVTATNLATEIDSRANLSASSVGATITITTSDRITKLSCASNLGSTFTLTKIEFVCNSRQTTLGSLTIHQKMSTLMRAMVGSWVEEVTVKTNSSAQPTISFKLGGKNIITTGVTGIASITDSDTLVVDKSTALEVNSLVQFEDSEGELDTNSGAGYLVSSESTTTKNFSTNHNAADTDTIFPFLPTPVYLGEAISDVSGSFQIDGDDFDITNFEVTVKNNIKPHEDNAFQETVSDYTQSWREVEGKFSIRCNEDEVEELTKYYSSALLEFEVIAEFGDTAGSRMRIEMPRCQKVKTSVQTPGDGDVMIDVEFLALATDYQSSDAIVIIFD